MKSVVTLGVALLIATGALAAERTPPEVLKQVPPVYTKAMRTKLPAGVVIVSFVVAEDGKVKDVKATKSPDPELSEAAVACVRKWKFRPATVDGKPVSTLMEQPIVFNPRG